MGEHFVCPGEAERARYAEIVSHGFGFPVAEAPGWFEYAGLENVRVLVIDGQVAGGLIAIPMGQFFGGRSVKTIGVSGVGIAPEMRGRGVGSRLMLALEEEAKKSGYALGCLYGATNTVYERVGYARTGARYKISVDSRMLQSLREDTGDATMEPVAGAPAELRALYSKIAATRPGYLDRGPYVWHRVVSPRGLTTKSWLVREGGRVTGYVVLATKFETAAHDVSLTVTDMMAETRAAAIAILKHLGSYASVAPKIVWQGAPSDAFLALLPERHHTTEVAWYFMDQIVDLPRAIASRGYPKGVSGSAVIEVRRTRVKETQKQTWRFEIEGGAAKVTPSSDAPALSIDEQGLVALYTGFLGPTELVTTGALSTRDGAAIELLSTSFAGAAPAMCDHF